MQKKWVIERCGLYVVEILGNSTEGAAYRFLRDEHKALRFTSAEAAAGCCPPSFKVTEYKIPYKDLEAQNDTLKELIDTFIVHSNGMSKHVRFPGYKARLLSEESNKDLVQDLQDLYNYQCTVETKLQEMNQ